MATFTNLPVIGASTITDSHVFAVATSTSTDQLSLNQLQKSFTGLTARVDSLSIIGHTVPSGITVGDNGYVGINNFTPTVTLDIGDQGLLSPQVRLKGRTAARQVSYSLGGPDVLWRTTKKSSDTDYYLQFSTDNGSNFTGVLNIDTSGRFGLFTGTAALTDQLFVSGGTVKFLSEESGIYFDPQNADISSYIAGDPLTFNYSSQNDVIIGTNVLYVENGINSYVGINNITPSYPLDISGAGLSQRIKSSTSSVSLALANTTTTGYVNLNSNSLSFGTFNGLSDNNLVYNISSKRLGVGEGSMAAKLHVKSSDYITNISETQSRDKSEVLYINSYSSGPVGMLFSTYATGTASSPIRKWSAGLYNSGSYLDSYALVYGGGQNNSAVKFVVNSNGDVNAKGSYYTNNDYCKGKFINIHHTRVTGDCIYFNPFYYGPGSCGTNPSGHSDTLAPFSISPYGGKIEEVQILTSDSQLSSLSNLRLQVVSVQPLPNAGITNGFVSGFYITPPSDPVTFPTSGIIGYADISTLNRNEIGRFTDSVFQGSTTFQSGRLLQYRICNSDGTKPYNVDFTIISKVSYTIN